MKCPTCGTETIQKSRLRLFLAGLAFVAAAVAFFFSPWWPAGILTALTAAYLLVWATVGKAQWCRTCKTFRIRS